MGAGVRRTRRQGPRRRERLPASKEAVANPVFTAVILGQARPQRQAAADGEPAALRSRSGANGGGRAGAVSSCASWGTDSGRHIAIGGWSIRRPRSWPRALLTGFRRCVFTVCLCREVLDVALQLPDNFRADEATRNDASRRRDDVVQGSDGMVTSPLLDPTMRNEAQLRVHSSTILQGQGRPAELPRRSRGSGGRALAKPRFLRGGSRSAAARSIRWVVMHPGGADVAARSSSLPLGVDYRTILEKEGPTGIRAVARVP